MSYFSETYYKDIIVKYNLRYLIFYHIRNLNIILKNEIVNKVSEMTWYCGVIEMQYIMFWVTAVPK